MIGLYSPNVTVTVAQQSFSLHRSEVDALVFMVTPPEGILPEDVEEGARRTSAWLVDTSVESHDEQLQITLTGPAVQLTIENLFYEFGSQSEILGAMEALKLHLQGRGPIPERASATTIADFIRLVEGLVAP